MIVQLQSNFIEEISKELLEIIPHGEKNAISSREIENQMHISHDVLRKCLRYLRENGAVICTSTTLQGRLFKPLSPTECSQYLADERRRILTLSRSIREAELYSGDVPFLDKLTGGSGRTVKS